MSFSFVDNETVAYQDVKQKKKQKVVLIMALWASVVNHGKTMTGKNKTNCILFLLQQVMNSKTTSALSKIF